MDRLEGGSRSKRCEEDVGPTAIACKEEGEGCRGGDSESG